ncbi:MAG: Crp/Fnr family transcriptional regulator [Pedobacter sp.]|nr:MAG: Crp/Fnr family transcriptional regulator [Pedobacter sp.]
MNIRYLTDHRYPVTCYKKDSVVYRAGGKPGFVYFIKSGKVKMVTTNSDGDEFIQGIFQSGDHFGEPALILNKVYLADTVVMEPTELIRVSRADFMNFVKLDKEFAVSLIEVLSTRLFYKSMMLEEIANERAEHRLLTVLNYLMEPLKSGDQLAITRKQLGDMTGLRVETVIRTLKLLAGKEQFMLSGTKIYKR